MTIETYLDGVLKYLEGKIPNEVADVRLLDLDDRLQAMADVYQANGLGPQAAIDRAIADLGAPEVVGQEIVREYLGYATKSSWALSRWVAVVMFVGMIASFAVRNLSNVWSSYDYHWDGPVFGVIAWLSVAVWGAWIWRTRRWLSLPVAVIALPICLVSLNILTYCWFSGLPRANPIDTTSNQKSARDWLESQQPQIDAIAEWKRGQPPTDVGPFPNPIHDVTYVPLLPVPWFSTRYSYDLKPMSPQDAKRAWSEHGKDFVTQSNFILDVFRSIAGDLPQRAPVTAAQQLWRATRAAAPLLAIGIGLLFFWNGLFLWIFGLVDKLRNHRFRSRVDSSPLAGVSGTVRARRA